MMEMKYLSFNHTCTNNSDLFVLVGNCRDFISSHKTLEDAVKELESISIGESKWAKVQILEPNETASLSNLQKTLHEDSDYDWSVFP